MKYNIPNQNILKAFGVSGETIRLTGGQGACYKIDNLVLKPAENEVEATWVAGIYNNLNSDKFRIAKPVRANNNAWVFDGWTASLFVEGKHIDGNYQEVIETSKLFHKALVGIPQPPFLDNNKNAWAIADRIAWEELPIPDDELTYKPLKKIFSLIRNNKLPNQIIHGDIGGNILFDSRLKPAVIDFCPYWRPADFAIAIVIIDALVWQNADESIIELCNDIEDFDQLLLRALVRRICEYVEHQKNNNKNYSEDILKHLNIADVIINRV